LCDSAWSFETQYDQDGEIPSFYTLEPGLNFVVIDDYSALEVVEDHLP